MAIDLTVLPDLVCGQTYRDPDSEARVAATREGEETPFTGCGEAMAWLIAYRCRQCARWMHGPCIDRHFGAVGCPATRDGKDDLHAENERLTEERDEARQFQQMAGHEIDALKGLLTSTRIDRDVARVERDALAGQVAALREALDALSDAAAPFARRMQQAVEHQEKWRADHPGQMPPLLNSDPVPMHWTYTPMVGEARRLVAALAAAGGESAS